MATVKTAHRKINQQRSMFTSLPLYYEGFLWIKRPRSKEAKYWTELRGTKLFLYTETTQEKFTDSIDLRNLSSVSDKQWVEVVLTLDKEEVIIKTETAEVAEEWKGFILTVVKQSVPTYLTLLPGQIIRLKEVLEKETIRREEEKCPVPPPSRRPDKPSPGPYDDVADPMPLCFHKVSRNEAAEMLMKNESFGNLILRPGADGRNYAVTIRESSENSNSFQVKHYKIVNTNHKYTIELDRPVILQSLDDVVSHFVTETRGKLKPYVTNLYDTHIDTITEDTQKTSHQTNVRNIVSQLSANKFKPAKRGMENAYVNVFPGN